MIYAQVADAPRTVLLALPYTCLQTATAERGDAMRRLFILSGFTVVLFTSLNSVASSQSELVDDGVTTGRVATLTGEPMVGVKVIAVMVKNLSGDPERRLSGERPRLTDDRGVY